MGLFVSFFWILFMKLNLVIFVFRPKQNLSSPYLLLLVDIDFLNN